MNDSISNPNADPNKDNIETFWYTVFDPASNREYFRIYDNYNIYSLQAFNTVFKDGLISVSSENYSTDVDDLTNQEVFLTSQIDTLTTKMGTFTPVGNDITELLSDVFHFSEGDVRYDFGNHIYTGSLTFNLKSETKTIYDACDDFDDYASSLGLTLHADMNNVAKAVEHSKILSENFTEMFIWKGYTINTMNSAKMAYNSLLDNFEEVKSEYNNVKDNPIATNKQKLDNNAHFAPLKVSTAGENTFTAGKINISNITVNTSEVDLFESGLEYVLSVGLSLIDDNGNPISVNTISLDGGNSILVTFSGNSITLTGGGEFDVPKNLTQGKYAVVVYVATKDEGIRVTELKKIAFLNADTGEIESTAMKIESSFNNGNLIFEYTIKNIRQTTITAAKDNYSYDEIERLLTIEILSYGAPYHGAVLQGENGETIDKSAY